MSFPSGPLHRQRQEAQALGQKALLYTGGSLAAFGLSAFLFPPSLTFLVATAGLAVSGFHAWRWLSFRARWGLRF